MASRYSYIAPVMVHGGYQVAEITEARTPEGWEADYEALSPTKYPSFSACLAAIAALQARALARAA